MLIACIAFLLGQGEDSDQNVSLHRKRQQFSAVLIILTWSNDEPEDQVQKKSGKHIIYLVSVLNRESPPLPIQNVPAIGRTDIAKGEVEERVAKQVFVPFSMPPTNASLYVAPLIDLIALPVVIENQRIPLHAF